MLKSIDFKKYNNLVPAIIQHANNGLVLMLGFMNTEALVKTIAEKKVTFFSRTKNRLWTKGEESGNFLIVEEIKTDCDQDTILIKALPSGNTCHKGTYTCFNETINEDSFCTNGFVNDLEKIISERKFSNNQSSYIHSLFDKGINKIAQKVGEEAIELVIEAKDSDDEKFLNEAGDLFFHYLILLQAKNFKLQDVLQILEKRHQDKN